MRAYIVFVQSQYDITCIGILTILRMFCCGDLAAADVHEDGNDDDGLPAATPETAATTELQKGDGTVAPRQLRDPPALPSPPERRPPEKVAGKGKAYVVDNEKEDETGLPTGLQQP